MTDQEQTTPTLPTIPDLVHDVVAPMLESGTALAQELIDLCDAVTRHTASAAQVARARAIAVINLDLYKRCEGNALDMLAAFREESEGATAEEDQDG